MKYNFPKKELRDKYAEELSKYLLDKTSEDSERGDSHDSKIENLKVILNKAIEEINPSIREGDKLFNNMQLTALLALEAVFFKVIAENENDHEVLYKKLYVENKVFQDKLEKLQKDRKENINSVGISDILANPPEAKYDANLQFQKISNEIIGNQSKSISLPRADENSALLFLANIDPQFMAYIVVNQSFTIQLEKHKAIDILHEALISIGVLCCTIVDTSLLLAPPAALGVAGFAFGGFSLPLTVGVSLLCLSTQLACHQILEPNQLNAMKNKMKTNIDERLNNPQVDIPLTPQQVYTPMQLFNIEGILIETIRYICASYQKHKKNFQRTVPEIATSIDELIRSRYVIWQNENEASSSIAELSVVKSHMLELKIISLNKVQ